MSEDKHWSLDRRVPLALIWTVLAQTGLAARRKSPMSAADHS